MYQKAAEVSRSIWEFERLSAIIPEFFQNFKRGGKLNKINMKIGSQ